MALFQRLFSSKILQKHESEARKSNDWKYNLQNPSVVKLDKSKIRLVIYADSDNGRIPWFDSNAIHHLDECEKHQQKTTSSFRGKGTNLVHQKEHMVQQKQGRQYHFQRLGSDVKMLEEMMFGSVAMAYKGSSLKIHLLRSPSQVMVTKVFIPEKPRRESVGEIECDASNQPGTSSDFSSGEFTFPLKKTKEKYVRSIPVDVPAKETLSDYSTDDDSGLASFTSSGSLHASFPSPNNNSTSSFNSLHRRWMRAQTTTLDGQSRRPRQDSSLVSERRVRKKKLAIGILFGPHDENEEENVMIFQSFFFSHFALIEGYVEKLRSVIEKAFFNSNNFLPQTMEALAKFRNALYDLYMAPRLSEPVWLTMMSTTTYKTRLCQKFMQEFVALVTKYDNKHCKFFVSTLLSAVLTQHLAWVATVTPAGGTPSKTYLDKHSAKWVDTLAKTHPYNPLWAQLGDLFGAIGLPLKISRTVIVGKKADVVKRFLYILSYFIRCSDIHETLDLDCLNNLLSHDSLEAYMSSTNDAALSYTSSLESNLYPILDPPSVSQNYEMSNFVKSGSNSDIYFHKTELLNNSCDLKNNFIPKITCDVEVNNEPFFSDSKKGYCVCVNSSNNVFDDYKLKNYMCNKCVDYREKTDQMTMKPNYVKNISEKSEEHKNNLFYSSIKSETKICAICGKKIPIICVYCKTLLTECNFKNLTTQVNVVKVNSDCKMNSPLSHSGELLEQSSNSLKTNLKEFQSLSESSLPVCSPTNSIPHESPLQENVLVSRGSDSFSMNQGKNDIDQEPVLRSHSFSEGKIRSRLAQQLESDQSVQQLDSDQLPKDKKPLKKQFLNVRSNSMFDEYLKPVTNANSSDINEGHKDFVSSSNLSTRLFQEGKKDCDFGKTSFLRQNSQDVTSYSLRSTSFAQLGRSTTPKELSRRRHLSSNGSIDYETFDPLNHCKEIKMPTQETDVSQWNIKAFDRNFGRSLLASYTDHYMSDFVLHGTSDSSFKSQLLHDLQMTVQHSILDEPIDEAVCVIADTDNWTVEVASSKVVSISPSGCMPWASSQMVADLIESVIEIYRLKMSPEFCLMHLEDRLQEIYFKSLMLSEYIQSSTVYSQQELTSMLGFETSDMALLIAIAGTHAKTASLDTS